MAAKVVRGLFRDPGEFGKTNSRKQQSQEQESVMHEGRIGYIERTHKTEIPERSKNAVKRFNAKKHNSHSDPFERRADKSPIRLGGLPQSKSHTNDDHQHQTLQD